MTPPFLTAMSEVYGIGRVAGQAVRARAEALCMLSGVGGGEEAGMLVGSSSARHHPTRTAHSCPPPGLLHPLTLSQRVLWLDRWLKGAHCPRATLRRRHLLYSLPCDEQ